MHENISAVFPSSFMENVFRITPQDKTNNTRWNKPLCIHSLCYTFLHFQTVCFKNLRNHLCVKLSNTWCLCMFRAWFIHLPSTPKVVILYILEAFPRGEKVESECHTMCASRSIAWKIMMETP